VNNLFRKTNGLRSNRLVLLAVIAGVIALVSGCTSGTPIRTSSQADYPVLPEPDFITTVPLSLSEQVTGASLIVDATVARVLPDETVPLNVDPNSPEGQINAKIGADPTTITYGVISFRVGQVLKGTAAQTVTMKISPLARDCSPDFQPGDRLVLMLAKSANGDYFSVAIQDAYWYVASDLRVYPAVVTDQLRQYSGTTLASFEASVKNVRG